MAQRLPLYSRESWKPGNLDKILQSHPCLKQAIENTRESIFGVIDQVETIDPTKLLSEEFQERINSITTDKDAPQEGVEELQQIQQKIWTSEQRFFANFLKNAYSNSSREITPEQKVILYRRYQELDLKSKESTPSEQEQQQMDTLTPFVAYYKEGIKNIGARIDALRSQENFKNKDALNLLDSIQKFLESINFSQEKDRLERMETQEYSIKSALDELEDAEKVHSEIEELLNKNRYTRNVFSKIWNSLNRMPSKLHSLLNQLSDNHLYGLQNCFSRYYGMLSKENQDALKRRSPPTTFPKS